MSSNAKTLKASKIACWIALACLVVPMFGSYFFDDMFSTVSHIFKNPQMLQLGWDAADFGLYAGAYSLLCVWGGLVICGILLDIYGVRLVGSIFVGLMVLGSAVVTFAISNPSFSPKTALAVAYAGCTVFGLGSEIAGVAVTRSIAKWFKGKNVALAMGLQLAIARLGTAFAFFLSPILVAEKVQGEVYLLSDTNKPAIVGLALLFAGAILWAVFVAMDARYDKQEGIMKVKGEVKEDDKFRFSDILKVLSNGRFIMISLLCVFFYCCIISFKKFGTSILMPRFDLNVNTAKWMITMIPFFTVVFTPLFGALVDKIGKATTWMISGAVLVFLSHILIAFAPEGVPFWGYFAIALLGVGYSLVPSAMWPTVPKIVPEKNLGTAYSLIYWIQNMGMLLVPIFVGAIFKNQITADPADMVYHSQEVVAAVHAEYIFLGLGIVAITVAVLLSINSRKHPELKIDCPSKEV
ncbi:MAG: MFS transporter [Bacteroidales bacterium]|nr:MFS transporter [Candidatus Cacconaster merdequi]